MSPIRHPFTPNPERPIECRTCGCKKETHPLDRDATLTFQKKRG